MYVLQPHLEPSNLLMGLGSEYWSFPPASPRLRPAAAFLAFSHDAGCLLLCVHFVCTWELLDRECHIESFLFSQLNQRHDWEGWQLPRPCCESTLSDHWCKCCFSHGAALCPSLFPTLPHPTFHSAFLAFAFPFTLGMAFPYQLLFPSPCRVPCCRPLSATWSRRLLTKYRVCPALLSCLLWYVLLEGQSSKEAVICGGTGHLGSFRILLLFLSLWTEGQVLTLLEIISLLRLWLSWPDLCMLIPCSSTSCCCQHAHGEDSLLLSITWNSQSFLRSYLMGCCCSSPSSTCWRPVMMW